MPSQMPKPAPAFLFVIPAENRVGIYVLVCHSVTQRRSLHLPSVRKSPMPLTRTIPSALALLAVLSAAANAQSPGPLATQYKPAADKLIAASLADPEGYANLAYLCDHIGKRISGSNKLLEAISWSESLMKKEGLANVHTQPATVPHWVRGQESGEIIAPVHKSLHMLGLGMSVATPPEGITAEVVVVPDFAALKALPPGAVQGKIVVFNAPYKGYGQTVMYRTAGPSQAAALGAIAVLVRSITPLAVQLPHTGTTVYDEAQPKIPAAAISIEDALMLARLQDSAQKEGGSAPRVHLQMRAHLETPQPAFNVIGEIPGTEHPEQIVVLGGHIDSWDVGQGAQDDGSGIMATLAAVNLIHKSGLHPKRTIRIVFWVNEENGGAGGKAYRAALTDAELANHVAAIEMDGGAEAPTGYGYGSGGARVRAVPGQPAPLAPTPDPGEEKSFAMLQDIATLLTPIGANTIRHGGGGSDIGPSPQTASPPSASPPPEPITSTGTTPKPTPSTRSTPPSSAKTSPPSPS
jgi:Zn-dependent M28 family amino/carboxypeptidase